jgi:hypothetical protein
MCTVAPLASSSRRQASPIPEAPPVTTATHPSSLNVSATLRSCRTVSGVALFWHPA